MIIQREAEELYDAWRHFKGLPDFMSHLQSVEEIDERRSRWTAEGPLGTTITWEAEIINERPGELIAWRSVEGSAVDTAGSVRFEPSGEAATQVIVNLKYNPPAGKAGGSWLGCSAPTRTNKSSTICRDSRRSWNWSAPRPAVRAEPH